VCFFGGGGRTRAGCSVEAALLSRDTDRDDGRGRAARARARPRATASADVDGAHLLRPQLSRGSAKHDGRRGTLALYRCV